MASASNAARRCLRALRRAPYAQGISRMTFLPPACVATIKPFSTAQSRSFSTTRTRLRDETEAEDEDEDRDAEPVLLKKMYKNFVKEATLENLQALDTMAQEDGFQSMDDEVEAALRERKLLSRDKDTVMRIEEQLGENRSVHPQSFWHDEDDDECIADEDEFNEDDITSMAHGKLEEIRDMRHYARLTVWEMPLLSKFAKPFVPPSKEEVLRWRYTSYMGEVHPAETKVVLQFEVKGLGLEPVQENKLRKLAGPRYNPVTDVVKMSCESFEHQAQNKRYLSDLAESLIKAAEDATDTFEDVPLDLRHHEQRIRPRFPREWRMSGERRRQLQEHRLAADSEDTKKATEGQMIDGKQLIDDWLLKYKFGPGEKLEEQNAKSNVSTMAVGPGRGSRTRLGMRRPKN
ncbi:hypothetical protein CDD82_1793 [Ophiocordyceps australis]|uniref:Small ribosomal subunit protein mS35 mitochondrial conserved domain-containing protein n=1 Tax=Ophiocordyceps australis TaxID=1399860 RepID=A0A2C5ZLV2_9HYPO|nr:hypothetical protein CDD82_1793 [Ophiocordyceps australis]